MSGLQKLKEKNLKNYNLYISNSINIKKKIEAPIFFKEIGFFIIVGSDFKNKLESLKTGKLLNFKKYNPITLATLGECPIKVGNNYYNSRTSLLVFINQKYFCFKKYFTKLSESRTESCKKFAFDNYYEISWFKFYCFSKSLMPINSNFKDKYLSNIVFLYNLRCYRGWRHVFGLPTKGQRTWSNGKTATKSFNFLKDAMFNIFKEGLSSAHPSEVRSSFGLEQLNIFWMDQWKAEWDLALEKRTTILRKSKKQVKFEANTLIKLNPNFLRSKKQVLIPIGFEPGYSKYYLKELKFAISKK